MGLMKVFAAARCNAALVDAARASGRSAVADDLPAPLH